ncbi:MAG: formate/nitrite transporter family protein [Microthrixaceae bacterium]|nr:formate/nitrite transporter family protein [Microthrixaceae bacterium]
MEPSDLDALLPAAMARRAEAVGEAKAEMPALRMFTLAVLAGAFISFGAAFATVATTGAEARLGFGPARALGGVAFSLGLVLVVVGGAELFTGNNLLVMAWVSRRVRARAVLRNWAIVYVGNFVGALGVAGLVFASGQYRGAKGAVGRAAVETASAKVSLDLGSAFLRGILANVLVCLAVWLCFSARSVTDKVLAIVLPITAFVAMGFEHSVANMYFLPLGLLIKGAAPDGFWVESGVTAAEFPDLTWGAFLLDNLVPVTLGNLVGGAVFVGLVYAFVYLRDSDG